MTVRVRLVFQAMTAAHVAALAAANTTDQRGTQLMQLWQQSGKAAPFVISEVTQAVHVGAPAPADAGIDGPAIDGGGGSGGGGGCGCAAQPGRPTGGGLLAFLAAALTGAASRRRVRRRRQGVSA